MKFLNKLLSKSIKINHENNDDMINKNYIEKTWEMQMIILNKIVHSIKIFIGDNIH